MRPTRDGRIIIHHRDAKRSAEASRCYIRVAADLVCPGGRRPLTIPRLGADL